MNSNVRAQAQAYFEAAENSEKFIKNYQELKLNIEVPYETRKSLHDSVHTTLGIAKEKRRIYEQTIPTANDCLKGFITKM